MVQVEIRRDHFASLTKYFTKMEYQAFKLEKHYLIPVENLPLHKQYNFDTLFVPLRHFNRVRPFIKDGNIKRRSPQPVKYADLQADP